MRALRKDVQNLFELVTKLQKEVKSLKRRRNEDDGDDVGGLAYPSAAVVKGGKGVKGGQVGQVGKGRVSSGKSKVAQPRKKKVMGGTSNGAAAAASAATVSVKKVLHPSKKHKRKTGADSETEDEFQVKKDVIDDQWWNGLVDENSRRLYNNTENSRDFVSRFLKVHDVDAVTKIGISALEIAVHQHNVELVRAFLDAIGRKEAERLMAHRNPTKDNFTPLHFCLKSKAAGSAQRVNESTLEAKKRLEREIYTVASLLLDHGADVNALA